MIHKHKIFGFILRSLIVHLFLLTFTAFTPMLNIQSRHVSAHSVDTFELTSGTTFIDAELVAVGRNSAYDPTNLVNLSNGQIYLPLVLRNWPSHPIPNISPINNQDQDNYYTVSWQNTGIDDNYILEEAMNASFSNAKKAYQGPKINWTVPSPGKLPGAYYYRAKATNAYSESDWSGIKSVTIYPLFVGLKLRWDGVGYIRGSDYYDVGAHAEKVFDILTEPDIIRSKHHSWYTPNPQGWEDSYWNSFYSISTGHWKGSNIPGDPSWKWGHSWKLGYDTQFVNGETVTIDGQKFTVTGPHGGVTTWGTTIQYWEFTNQERILYWDGGGDWTVYIHIGDAVLRYDVGNSGLLLYENIFRHDYYQGAVTTDTAQYIINLSSATSLPNSPIISISDEIGGEPHNTVPHSISPNDHFQKEFIQPAIREKGAMTIY